MAGRAWRSPYFQATPAPLRGAQRSPTALRARGVSVRAAGGAGHHARRAPCRWARGSRRRWPTCCGCRTSPSDNFMAEMLIKALGARFGGAGSTAAGAAVVRAELGRVRRRPPHRRRLRALAPGPHLAARASSACSAAMQRRPGLHRLAARGRPQRHAHARACAGRPPRTAAGPRPARCATSRRWPATATTRTGGRVALRVPDEPRGALAGRASARTAWRRCWRATPAERPAAPAARPRRAPPPRAARPSRAWSRATRRPRRSPSSSTPTTSRARRRRGSAPSPARA